MSTTSNRASAGRVAGVALAGALGCLVFSTPLLAADEAPCMTVNYRDLNLSTPAGAATLYRRISGAARSVCGERGYGLFFGRQWDSCYREAVAGAVTAINSPLLTDVHRRENRMANATALAIW